MKPTAFVIVVLKKALICAAVMAPGYSNLYNGTTPTIWEQCWSFEGELGDISAVGMNIASCMKQKMYLGLVESSEQQCVDIGDGVTFENSAESVLSPRDLFPHGEEPGTFRGLVDAYSTFLSRRGLRWDLSHLYPGLAMRVGPTLNGAGVLEFVMDRKSDYHDRGSLGPGQLGFRRTILPHLLGFRMNLLHLLPLVFGVLVYVAKNAFIFSKITLIITTLLTLKSLFVLQHLRPPASHHSEFDHVAGSEAVSFTGGPRPQPHSIHPAENLILQMFTAAVPPFRGVNDRLPEDPFRGVDNLPPRPEEFRGFSDKTKPDRGERNFSWE